MAVAPSEAAVKEKPSEPKVAAPADSAAPEPEEKPGGKAAETPAEKSDPGDAGGAEPEEAREDGGSP